MLMLTYGLSHEISHSTLCSGFSTLNVICDALPYSSTNVLISISSVGMPVNAGVGLIMGNGLSTMKVNLSCSFQLP